MKLNYGTVSTGFRRMAECAVLRRMLYFYVQITTISNQTK